MSAHPSARHLELRARAYLERLCAQISSRQVGSEGNREATAWFASLMESFGFQCALTEFRCLDWTQAGLRLAAGEDNFSAFVGPYSPACAVRGPLAVADNLGELEGVDAGGRILLLRGNLTREQLMPKNFPFYNPAEHQHVIRLLESKAPLAVLAATTRDTAMTGAAYPFPLIEDGDFDIPSAYMTEEEGARLVRQAGREVFLEIRAERREATGRNVTAHKGPQDKGRVVLMAHIDAKAGTPGALDNAAGVAVLLLTGELLADYAGKLGIEIVAMNGEDYYSNPGEQQYLARNAERFESIVLGINVDGAGYRHGRTAYSLYGCPEDLTAIVREALGARADMVEGEAWAQGDHSLFVLNGRPALALTSERAAELMAEVIHTPGDTPELVDTARLAGIASALRGLVGALARG